MGVGYIIAAIICDIVVAIFGFMSEDTWIMRGMDPKDPRCVRTPDALTGARCILNIGNFSKP